MDTRIRIDGLYLPELLNKLVQAGKWKTPTNREFWSRFVDEQHIVQPRLYPLNQLDGREVWKSEAGDGFLGVEDDELSPGTIDPSRAVIIGDLGPERLIALDYRTSDENPSVCAFLPREEDDSCWVELASSLDDFIAKLELTA